MKYSHINFVCNSRTVNKPSKDSHSVITLTKIKTGQTKKPKNIENMHHMVGRQVVTHPRKERFLSGPSFFLWTKQWSLIRGIGLLLLLGRHLLPIRNHGFDGKHCSKLSSSPM